MGFGKFSSGISLSPGQQEKPGLDTISMLTWATTYDPNFKNSRGMQFHFYQFTHIVHHHTFANRGMHFRENRLTQQEDFVLSLIAQF